MRYLVRFLRICGLVLIASIGCFGGGEEEGCEPVELPPLCLFGDCEPDPCEGVVCPPDDNVCTREYCSGGSCRSEPGANGRSCTYDGLSGVCVNGVCGENLCEGVSCDDDACTDGTCDYVDGTCDFTPVVCQDQDPCTENACDPVDGCIFTAVEDGTVCGSPGWMCIAGDCVLTECGSPEDCDDRNECTEDTCSGGMCENPPVEDGTSCANGAGTCQAGSCVGTFACTEQGIRDAIAVGGGPHTFDCDGPQTAVTTAAEIVIDNDVILDGEGNLTVDGSATHRVFSVAAYITVELRGVTVTGGATPERGGGIHNEGQLTLTNCTVSGNTADFGGGINNGLVESELTLRNSTVSGNSGARSGGGIMGGGAVTLMNSTVSRNTAGLDLPGLSRGGGIFLAGDLTLTNSTVSDNIVTGDGGGIFFNSGIPSLTLTHSTVSGNTSYYGAAGLAGYNAKLTNTLVDNDCAWFDVEIVSGGYNVESPGDTCGFDQATDQVNVPDPMLGPLQDNGGPTETHVLEPGSVAIDRIPEADCGVATDQRGLPRPGGTMCDVGAFEVQP